MANAIAITGAIIESIEGSSMKYYSRCNHCQDVTNSTTRTSVPSVGSFTTSNHHCSKCGKDTPIRIKGL